MDVVTIRYNDAGKQDWIETYAGSSGLIDFGSSNAFANGAVDAGGSVTDSSTDLDFVALKYNSSGTLVWSTELDYNGLSDVCSHLILGDGDADLAGATNTSPFDWDMLTVKFYRDDGSYCSACPKTLCLSQPR